MNERLTLYHRPALKLVGTHRPDNGLNQRVRDLLTTLIVFAVAVTLANTALGWTGGAPVADRPASVAAAYDLNALALYRASEWA